MGYPAACALKSTTNNIQLHLLSAALLYFQAIEDRIEPIMPPNERRAPTGHVIVDRPRDFLQRELHDGPGLGVLESPPDLDFLKWLPTLPNSTGLVLEDSVWYIIQGNITGIFLGDTRNSKVIVTVHQGVGLTPDESLPSVNDFNNCSPTARNYVVSEIGITEYWRPETYEGRREVEREVFHRMESGRVLTPDEHAELLERVEAEYQTYRWEDLTEEKITELLTPNQS